MKEKVKEFLDALSGNISVALDSGFIVNQSNKKSLIDSIIKEYHNTFPPVEYKVVCDETNNSKEDIDNNIIIVDVYKV